MTTQHAPHTPPMWRRGLSLPHTRLGWLSLGLAAVSMVLLTFAGAAVISPSAFKALGIELEWILLEWILWSWFFSLVASGVVGLIALQRGQEHSWIVLVVAFLGVFTLFVSPILPFVIQGVFYALNSPFYSP